MKNGLTFILLLITIAGTFFPCCLVDECNNEEIALAQSHNDQDPKANCSPFFACASCPGFAVMSKPVQMLEQYVENQVFHETLIVFNPATHANSFWQPPRSS